MREVMRTTTYRIGVIICMIVFSIFSVSSFFLVNQKYVYAEDNGTTTDKNTETSESEQCSACIKTAPQLERYVKFSNEIIDAMQKYANTKGSVFTTKDRNYGSSNDTNEDSEILRALRAITDGLNEKRQTAASSAYLGIFTAGEMIRNNWYSTAILGSSKALTRDRDILEEVQQKSLNVATDLGNKGVFIRIGFMPGLEEAIQEILQTYSNGEDALFELNKGGTATSQPILIFSDLWSMTNNIKLGLYDGTLFGLYGLELGDPGKGKYMGKNISLSSGFIENMISYYKCAKGIKGVAKCSTFVKSTDNRFKNIAEDGKEQAGYAIKTFKTAWKRLVDFRATNGESEFPLENREYELLRDQYGWEAQRDSIVKDAVEGRSKGKKTIKETYTNVVAVVEGAVNSLKPKKKRIRIGDQQVEAISDLEKETMVKIGTDTAKEANQSRHESEYGNAAAVTKLFPILTQNIIAQKLLIDGKGDKTTIYENLRSSCLNQCTNVPGKKCSYDE